MQMRCLALLLSCIILPLFGADPPSISPALTGALRRSGLPEAAESVVIPLESNITGAFIVESLVDGKPVQLVLDSGAAFTVLSPETARKIGLQAMGNSESTTSATGERVVGQTALTKRISLGDAWTENEPVLFPEPPAKP